MTVTATAPPTTPEAMLDELNERYPHVRIELSAEGIVEITMTPVARHQRILSRLSFWLGKVLGDPDGTRVVQGLGVRAGTARRVPDLAVLRAGADVPDDVVYLPANIFALVVEVESRSTKANDRGAKVREYARAGIPRYWIVDGDDQVTMYALSGTAYAPHTKIPLSALLSGALPAGVDL